MTTQDTRDPREVALRDVMDDMDKLGDNVRFILQGHFPGMLKVEMGKWMRQKRGCLNY